MSAVSLLSASLGAMVLGCAAVGGVGQVARSHAYVDATADLVALATAAQLARGEPVDRACAAGAGLAAEGGAQLVRCEVDGMVVTVTLSLDVEVLAVPASLGGRARAGPADLAGGR